MTKIIIDEMENEISKKTKLFFTNQDNSIIAELPLFQHISNLPLNNITNKPEENMDIKLLTKKRGRKNKCLENSILDENKGGDEILTKKKIHGRFSNDNIRRKIKALFHKYIISLLNDRLKQKFPQLKKKFVKMNKRITVDIRIEYNRNLIDKNIKDIIIDVSNKYNNQSINKNCIKIIEKQKDNEDIINILDMKYKDLYINRYLKSTKDDIPKNSFEEHKETLLKQYGKEYLDLFIQNAENIIKFFTFGKNRKLRKLKEVEAIDIHLDSENVETKSTNEPLNNTNNENSHGNKIMVSTCIQTDIYDIHKKLIAFG